MLCAAWSGTLAVNRAPAPAGTYSATPPSDLGLDGARFDGRLFGAKQPDFRRLDLVLCYDLPPAKGVSVSLAGEVYNATSAENFLSVGNNIAGTDGFLTPTSTYDPGGRQYRAGEVPPESRRGTQGRPCRHLSPLGPPASSPALQPGFFPRPRKNPL